MYYTIKRQATSPLQCFIGFHVPKYIASKKNDSVIFEFLKEGKAIRKWIKKEDIILLTEDKEFFIQTMEQFKSIEAIQKKIVDKAREQLDKSLEAFTNNVNAELNEFHDLKSSSNVPCLLKDL